MLLIIQQTCPIKSHKILYKKAMNLSLQSLNWVTIFPFFSIRMTFHFPSMDFILQNIQSSPLLFFIVPLVLLLLTSILRRPPRLPLPPGPKGLPIIGNMRMIDQLTHRGLAAMAKRYGGIFHLRIGFLHMVAISDPDVAWNVLQVWLL